MVTLGARWPLLCHPFVLYIGKTWPSHGPNMVHFKSDVISVKNFKKLKKSTLYDNNDNQHQRSSEVGLGCGNCVTCQCCQLIVISGLKVGI